MRPTGNAERQHVFIAPSRAPAYVEREARQPTSTYSRVMEGSLADECVPLNYPPREFRTVGSESRNKNALVPEKKMMTIVDVPAVTK